MTDRPIPEDDRALLAAEYALGLLDPRERLEAERLRIDDPAFASEIEVWEKVRQDWIQTMPGEAPSAGLEERVVASLNLATDGYVRQPASYWKPAALAASVAAIVFAALWLSPAAENSTVVAESPFSAENFSVAQINGAEAEPMVSAMYDRESGTIYVRLAEIPDVRRVPQLWLLDAEGTPQSLGFGHRNQLTAMQLSEQQRAIIESGGTLAISLEEPAEQPHETPGEVVGAAQLDSLRSST